MKLTKVREFGLFSGKGEIEAIAVDDERNAIYYADEGAGVYHYSADPDSRDAANEVSVLAQSGFGGDREGIAAASGTPPWLVLTDQLAAGSRFYFYPLDSSGSDQNRRKLILQTTAESTDGIDVVRKPLGPDFPVGMMVVMNNAGNNFFFYRWEDVEKYAVAGPHAVR